MRRSNVVAALVVALAAACGASSDAGPDQLCKPNQLVFCRCQDRQEGTKQCNEKGTAYGTCDPCETWDNPEIPDDGSGYPPRGENPFPDEDGGVEEPPLGCGDGVVQAGEDCDDKNDVETDGCSKSCKLAGVNPASTLSCPGLEVHVWGGAHKPTLSGSTIGGGTHRVAPACEGQAGTTTGSTAPDRLFKIVAHKTGTLTATLTDTSYNALLYVAAACPAGDIAYLACKNEKPATTSGANESIGVPVEAGKTYHVFVDGVGVSADKQGDFKVTFEIP